MTPKQIWRRATKVFFHALPDTWGHRDEQDQEDFCVDIQIETKNELDRGTGTIFKVQLKGAETPKVDRNGTTISLRGFELHWAEYLLEKIRIPAVIAVVDVSQEQVYWVGVQNNGDLMKAYRDAKSAGRDTLTVHIPIENTLPSTCDKLLSEVALMADRIAATHENVVQLSLQHQRQRFEEMDPRFSAKASADESGTKFTFTPKEDVEFKFSIPKALSHDIIGRGLRCKLSQNDFKVSGAPIIEYLASRGDFEIQVGTKLICNVEMVLLGSNGNEIDRHRGIDGTIAGGRNEFQIVILTPSGILGLEVGWFPIPPSAPADCQTNLKFDVSSWMGRKLLDLPYFTLMRALLGLDVHTERIRLEFWLEGQRVFAPTFPLRHLPKYPEFQELVWCLDAARQLAFAFGVEPQVPTTVTFDDLDNIEHLAWLYSDDLPTRSASQWSINTKVSKVAAQTFMGSPIEKLGVMKRCIDGKDFQIFNTKINIGRVEYTYENVQRVSTDAELEAQCASATADDVELRLRGTETTTISAHKLDLVRPVRIDYFDGRTEFLKPPM
jgi:hypothetical protein